MIRILALRNIVNRPLRSLLLLFGYGTGVAVMIVLLSIGEALLAQARDEKLVGGGEITVLPQGLDVEVMKTGGVGGLFFSIDHARFIYRQLLASPRLETSVAAAAPQIDGRLLYLRTMSGVERPIRAAGDIPSRTRAVGAGPALTAGEWRDDDGDRRWIAPRPDELRHEIDHFHLPSDVRNRDSWAEWHYFNVVSASGRRWAFISLIVAGDVTSDDWGGSVTITLREQNGGERRFVSNVSRERVRFSTSKADLSVGESNVTVMANGDYKVHAVASRVGGGASVTADLVVHPAAGAYFPGASLSSAELVSGYTVPALRADASGTICVSGSCERFDDAQSYHDHNWGVWRGVSWDWGAARAGAYTLLYGRVLGPDAQGRTTPTLVYLVDSLGFRAVFRPREISYVDDRDIIVAGNHVPVPSRATFADTRGADTLRIDLEIEDAIGTDTRRESLREERADRAGSRRYFIQMKGTARIGGRIGGEAVAGEGRGFFETYR
jgi:hypothetical protein